MSELAPDSRLRETKGRVFKGGEPWIPIFCANCGADGGYVPENQTRFATWLCQKPECEARAPEFGQLRMPDEIFWQRWHEAQLEKFGRLLTEDEIRRVLADHDHPLSKLAREF